MERILRGYCRGIGRDPRGLVNGYLSSLLIARTKEELRNRIKRRAMERGLPEEEYMASMRRGVAGIPEQCVQQVKAYQDAGVDHLILRFRDMKNLKPLELFAEEVVGAFRP